MKQNKNEKRNNFNAKGMKSEKICNTKQTKKRLGKNYSDHRHRSPNNNVDR